MNWCFGCKLVEAFARARKAWALAPYINDLHAVLMDRAGAALTPHDRVLMENALAFSEIVADDASTPRSEMVFVHEHDGLEKILRVFVESCHTRLPVIGSDIDDIKGFLLLKDAVAKSLELRGREADFRLEDILRPLPVVQESMDLPRVLHTMRRAKVTMVLVVDELGGTSGLLCLRDIMAELLGDVDDVQHGTDDAPLHILGAGRYQVRGDFALDDFDAAAGTSLFDDYGEDVETIGGAVLRATGRMPSRGDRVRLSPKAEALVVACTGRRILAVEIRTLG